MKTVTFFKTLALSSALALLSATAMAQAGPGNGPGAGGMRGMRFNQNNTPGWTLMSAEERSTHQAKMRATTTYAECKQLQDEQHAAMQARAQEKGVTLAAPRQNGCDNMKARGWIK